MAEAQLASRVLSSVQSFLRESNLDRVSTLSISQEQLKTSVPMLTSSSGLCAQVDNLITNLQHALIETRQRQIKVEENHTDSGESVDVKPDVNKMNLSLVQINASKSEIDRRIAAFMERKQVEVNDNNRREFCGIIDLTEEEDSCARTDAVFKARSGSKSHVKVSKVVNPYGPQTRQPVSLSADRSRPGPSASASSSAQTGQVPAAVDERINNMEKHLKLGMGQAVPKDVYSRIKRLEDRVLQLEGLSPEYFHAIPSVYKRQRRESDRREMNISEIDQRMKELKESLLKKKQGLENDKTRDNDVT
ncbi:MAP3K12-binding inhibitory protein 1-like [Ptychodera flava]|uniref:MAP3K12-binding inhibitory protein 1-like n=1 Tax=Ptychodera flava TaxID=63121 RepID=UPI00396A728C